MRSHQWLAQRKIHGGASGWHQWEELLGDFVFEFLPFPILLVVLAVILLALLRRAQESGNFNVEL